MTGEERPFTAAAVPAVERHCRETLAALLSRLSDAAGGALAGAALGGALGRGEAPTTVDAAGAFVTGAPFELLVVLEATPGRAASLAPHLGRELAGTARPRHAAVRVGTASLSALAHLPPTLESIECAAAARVVSGPPGLLEPMASLASSQPATLEALKLLVRRGAAFLAAERALSRRSAGRAAVLASRRRSAPWTWRWARRSSCRRDAFGRPTASALPSSVSSPLPSTRHLLPRVSTSE